MPPVDSIGVNRVLSLVGAGTVPSDEECSRSGSELVSRGNEQHPNDLTLSKILTFAPTFSVLTEVDLSGHRHIDPGLFKELVARMVPQLVRLNTLDLKNNNIGPEEAVRLFEALHKHCKKLRYLDVSDNNLGDESMKALTPILSDGSLEALGLSSNYLSPCGAVELARGIERNTTLEELALGFNELGDFGVLELADVVMSHPGLKMLDLSGNEIMDYGVSVLAYELKSKKSPLRQLHLGNNKIGDSGLDALSDALCSSSSLERLHLGGNSLISAEGRRKFTGTAARWRSLEYLDLTLCNLDERDGSTLAKAIKKPKCSLRQVVVGSDHSLTPHALQSLRCAMENKELGAVDTLDFLRPYVMDVPVYLGLLGFVGFVWITWPILRRSR